jgi:hypothetical protein
MSSTQPAHRDRVQPVHPDRVQLASLNQQPPSPTQFHSITTIFTRSTTASSYPALLAHQYLSLFNQQPPAPTELRSITTSQLRSINSRQLLSSFARSPPSIFVQSTAASSYLAALNHHQPASLDQKPPSPPSFGQSRPSSLASSHLPSLALFA